MTIRNVLLILSSVVGVVWLVVALKVRSSFRSLRWLSPGAKAATVIPKLSVIVPARNEEKGIDPALRSILKQEGVELEIIVVDDHSTDSTGELVDRIANEDDRIRVIHSPELRSGWLGKTNAMQTGADIATGTYLLFSDADITHAPGCFSAAIAEMEACRYDFLTLVPRFRWLGFWENSFVPSMAMGFAALVSTGLEDPERPNAIGIGAFLLVKASIYKKLGGHEAVRAKAVDDLEFAKYLKRHECHVGIRVAPSCLEVRMFSGLKEAFRSSVKGLFPALGYRMWPTIPIACLSLSLSWAGIATTAVGFSKGDLLLAGVGSLSYLSGLLSVLTTRGVFEYRLRRVMLYPIASLILVGSIAAAAYYKIFLNSILWRGRPIKVGSSS